MRCDFDKACLVGHVCCHVAESERRRLPRRQVALPYHRHQGRDPPLLRDVDLILYVKRQLGQRVGPRFPHPHPSVGSGEGDEGWDPPHLCDLRRIRSVGGEGAQSAGSTFLDATGTLGEEMRE